jgi:hypothetical protein
VSFSANETVPATGLPSAVTTQAYFVLIRSIGWLKRTDRTAPWSTTRVPLLGRKRTTSGAAVVVIVSGWTATTGAATSSTSVDRPTV